jgi:hypothetical protein
MESKSKVQAAGLPRIDPSGCRNGAKTQNAGRVLFRRLLLTAVEEKFVDILKAPRFSGPQQLSGEISAREFFGALKKGFPSDKIRLL